MLTLLINIAFGALFGPNEDMFQNYIQAGISAHPALFKPNDAEIIWRMVQRAHFHAGGIGAYSLGLVIVTALTSMSEKRKQDYCAADRPVHFLSTGLVCHVSGRT
jgi:hypothetical protein